MLFTVQLDPRVVAGDSHSFMRDQARSSAKAVEAAEVRLSQAHETYGVDPDDWTGATVVARAEENLERCQEAHAAVLLKLNWETTDRWKFADFIRREIAVVSKRHPKAFVRPWDSNPQSWLNCFSPRNIKPTK